MNTKTRVQGCAVLKNNPLALLVVFLAIVVAIDFDTMPLKQDESPVIVQSMRPNLCAKQQLQLSVTNHHVVQDTASQGYALLHRISSSTTTTATVFTLLMDYLRTNTNEPYGRVVPPAHDESSKVNQDDSCLERTNAPQVAASSGGAGGDDEEDPDEKKPNNDECGGDKSPSGQNENDQDDDQDHEPENGFEGEAVDVLDSNNPDDFLNVTFDDDIDIVLDEIVEVGVVDEENDEDMVRLWEE